MDGDIYKYDDVEGDF